MYFMYDWPLSYDELWGDEDMWKPLGDLLTKKGLALYYRRLAYDIPTYLHINLKDDNENALSFWYYASVVQHLGIGGKSEDPVIWQAHKDAMDTYMAHKRFFTHGAFYGIDEATHVHTLVDERAAVMNVFNYGDEPATREIRLMPAEVGLSDGPITVDGAEAAVEGDGAVILRVQLPARSHRLVKVQGQASK
jgi:hypothetical protein